MAMDLISLLLASSNISEITLSQSETSLPATWKICLQFDNFPELVIARPFLSDPILDLYY